MHKRRLGETGTHYTDFDCSRGRYARVPERKYESARKKRKRGGRGIPSVLGKFSGLRELRDLEMSEILVLLVLVMIAIDSGDTDILITLAILSCSLFM